MAFATVLVLVGEEVFLGKSLSSITSSVLASVELLATEILTAELVAVELVVAAVVRVVVVDGTVVVVVGCVVVGCVVVGCVVVGCVVVGCVVTVGGGVGLVVIVDSESAFPISGTVVLEVDKVVLVGGSVDCVKTAISRSLCFSVEDIIDNVEVMSGNPVVVKSIC